MGVKEKIRTLAPGMYGRVWLVKEYIRTRYFNEMWSHYYDATPDWIATPEPLLSEIEFPKYIDRFLDIGCASGRNFIPFDGKLRLWGMDIVDASRIKWVRPFTDLTYEKSSVEQFTRRLEKEPIDLSKTLIFTFGTLMYVSARNQLRFFEACKRRGCKNFIFIEYSPDSKKHSVQNFKLSESLFQMKELIHRKEAGPKAYMLLDKPK
jgi:hypothetical protein